MKEISESHLGWKKRISNWLNRLINQNWVDIGLRAKMSALVTIGLIGLIAVFAFIGFSTIQQSTQQLLREHALRVRILAGNLDSNLAQTEGLLTILSSQIDMADPGPNLQDWKIVYKKDFRTIQGIYLFDLNANQIAATSTRLTVDWKQVPALHIPIGGSSQIISTDGMPHPYAIMAMPVLRSQSQIPVGIMAIVIDLSNPEIFLSGNSFPLEQNGSVGVLDNNGQILVSSQSQLTLPAGTIQNITAHLFTKGQEQNENCQVCIENVITDTNTGAVIAFAPLSQAPWGVILWHNPQELYAPVRHVAVQALLLGILTMLGAFVLVIVTTRSVIVPLQMLTDAARQVGEVQDNTSALDSVACNLSATLVRKSVRRDEIGILSNSFVTMCRKLQQSLEEIHLWNRELDNRVQARTQQLSLLNMVALTVNQSLNLEDILNRALDEVCQLTGIDMVAIYLQDSSNGRLTLMTYRGLSEKAANLAHQVGLLDSSCGGVMEIEKAVVVPDISQYRGRGAESLQREHIIALMHVPLLTKGRSLGSMCVGTRSLQLFEDDEQKLLTAIGNQIAIAVENARLYAEVQRKERVRGGLFKKALAAQEDERKRIARELHDEISQSLTALLYEAEGGLETDEHPETRQRLQSICDITQSTLDNIHKLILDLRPSMLDQLGLISAVRWLTKTHLKSKGIHVTVEASSSNNPLDGEVDFKRLSPEIETALYRVVQEAISNIARYAAAHTVEIRLELHNTDVTVDIIDNGVGFDLTEISMAATKELEENDSFLQDNMRGFGIIGMQERIELLGGNMDISTAPGSGTQIHIHIPIQERSLVNDTGPRG
jgi:signal transduction histidine kinase